MEWDHVKPGKRADVSKLGSIPALMREVEKCELVCANCHRMRTVRRIESEAAEEVQERLAEAEQLGWEF